MFWSGYLINFTSPIRKLVDWYITNTYYPYIPVLGQISAVMSVVEALVPVLANPAYNQVYQHTLDSEFPGTVFLVTAGCMVICIIAFM